jgi:hypothetical protein
MKAKLYFCFVLFLCAAHYSNGYAGAGPVFGIGGGYYWERAADGANSSEGRMSAGGPNLGISFWGEALPWNGGISLNFIYAGRSSSSAYSIGGGNGIPFMSEQQEPALHFLELEVLATFDTFTRPLQFFAGGGVSLLLNPNKVKEIKDTLVETSANSFSLGLDIDTGFRLNIGRRLFLLLGADFSCYYFNYLEYLDKETQKMESRVNSFNVGYVMLGVAPYLSLGFNIKVWD